MAPSPAPPAKRPAGSSSSSSSVAPAPALATRSLPWRTSLHSPCAPASALAAAPAAAPSESRLAALLKEAGIKDGLLRGVYEDGSNGHGTQPWKSSIRRAGFEHVKGGRHASCAEASLRILEVYQGHPDYMYVASDRFVLAVGRRVNAEQLARLVDAARADAGR